MKRTLRTPVSRHVVGVIVAFMLVTVTGLRLPVTAAGATVSRHVLAVNCSSLGYLDYRPSYWGLGCTVTSPEVLPAHWVRWTETSAYATGYSYMNDCDCAAPKHQAKYRSTITLSRPVTCRQGARLRYFSRELWTIAIPRRNPFHLRGEIEREVFKAPPGPCSLDPFA